MIKAALAIAATLALGLAGPTCGQTLTGRIVAHASASAFAVLDPAEKLRRVKLAGADAPEPTQPHGETALALARQWLGGTAHRIEVVREDAAANRVHGRIQIDGQDLALKLIEAGLAWCDPHDGDALPADVHKRYLDACAKAKAGRQGLWRDAYPQPPWEYRRIPRYEPPPKENPLGPRPLKPQK